MLTHLLPVPAMDRQLPEDREFVTFTAVFTTPSSVPSTQHVLNNYLVKKQRPLGHCVPLYLFVHSCEAILQMRKTEAGERGHTC